jgi:hypothetical protein
MGIDSFVSSVTNNTEIRMSGKANSAGVVMQLNVARASGA